MQVLYDQYNVNPATLQCVAGKPNVEEKTFGMNETAHIQETIRKSYMRPKEKYSFPETEAQEIGWDYEMAINPRESLLSAPRNQTELTKFADALWEHEGAVLNAAREAARAAK